MSILLPLQVKEGRVVQASQVKTAVDAFLELLLTTACGSCVSDPQFGFVFNNLKFEIFNENEGVIYDSGAKNGATSELYSKKVSGTSKSINTFAIELKRAIEQYEKRLSGVSVSMAYVKKQKKIQIDVEGTLVETNDAYRYTTSIDIWN
ncbi:MAG TPA: GPW/gp25 family protein [Candidatus Alistipes pullicola]|nr:GPW/gp25 family protein [Candidatus Alistipes pullicola]